MKRKRPLSFVASEWSLALLALVLALLVWAVVWREISTETEPLAVAVELETSERFMAFPRGDATMQLRGPRGEVEEARRALGTPPTVRVRLEDLPEGEAFREIAITREMYAFPFPSRLVGEIAGASADQFRVLEQPVTFLKPVVGGFPPGVKCNVVMDPTRAVVRGPAGHAGPAILPDPIDVSAYFPDDTRDIVPTEARVECTFNAWRAEEDRYRSALDLPRVTAVVRFSVIGEKEIRNRVQFDIPDGYEITPSQKNERYSLGHYKGEFEGWQQDLERLKREDAKWWFVVRIPAAKLPAEGEEVTEDFPIEFFRSGSLDGLHVRLKTRETLLVVIRKKDG